MSPLARAHMAMLLTLGGCVPHATFTARGGSCPKRPANCPFELVSSRPARDYAVIGVIDLEAFHVPKLPNDEASFRAAIAKDVCEAGGDAVLPGINGNGRYVLATVVKWVEGPSAGPVCPAQDAAVSLPEQGEADAGVAPDAAAALGPQPDRGVSPRASLALANSQRAQREAQAGGASW
jgi:hypothetical protein